MYGQLRAAFVVFIALTVVTGIAYPLTVTAVGQAVFYERANGSIITKDGKAVGSKLIGQAFDDPKYFWGRPSATVPVPYNAAASTGSNLGPINPALLDAVRARAAGIKKAHPDQDGPVPVDLVTASASGLDPHISPAAADYQVARVAKARNMTEAAVRDIVARHTERRTFGILGEPRVNVLVLNLALYEAK